MVADLKVLTGAEPGRVRAGQALRAGGTHAIPQGRDARAGPLEHAIMMGEDCGRKDAPETRDLVFPFPGREGSAQTPPAGFQNAKPPQ